MFVENIESVSAKCTHFHAFAVQVAPVVTLRQNPDQNIHQKDGHAEAHKDEHNIYLSASNISSPVSI